MTDDSHSGADRPAKQGADDRREFITLFGERQQQILGYIAALVPNWQDAEDVFQRTSLVLWEKFDDFDPQRDFLKWACGVAYYEVRNHFRTKGRDRLCFNDELMNTIADQRLTQPKQSERTAALKLCLGKFDDSERRLVIQAYAGEGNIKQLAEREGRAAQTIYNRLSQLRRRLLECIDSTVDEESDR